LYRKISETCDTHFDTHILPDDNKYIFSSEVLMGTELWWLHVPGTVLAYSSLSVGFTTLKTWVRLKNSKYRCHRFSAVDAPHVQWYYRFSILETDTLDVGQQSPVLFKYECMEVESFSG
jgi:hypothetical protein